MMASAEFPFEIRSRVTGAASALFADVEHSLPKIMVADHVKNLNSTNRNHPGGVGLVLSEIGLIAGSTYPDYKAVSDAFGTLATLASDQDTKSSCILLQMAHLCLPRNMQGKVENGIAQGFQQVLDHVHHSHPEDQAVESITKMLSSLLAEQAPSPDALSGKPRCKRDRIDLQERQDLLQRIIPEYQCLATTAHTLLHRVSPQL